MVLDFLFMAIFLLFFNVTTHFKDFYNVLLLFGNTRKTILASMFGSFALFGAVYAVLSVLCDYLSTAISHIFHTNSLDVLSKIYSGSTPGKNYSGILPFC
jgi:hypothetical protein